MTIPGVEIRPAGPTDFDRLYEIHRAALGPYVTQVWGWDEAWQRNHFKEFLDANGIDLLLRDGAVIGFTHVVESPDQIMLSSIEIDPHCQGRGIGTAVINDLIVSARQTSRSVRLQVLKVNRRARELYVRLGFTSAGDTATHVQMSFTP
jgi:ribosomal protein S18 acetylase RimI-like enzyme